MKSIDGKVAGPDREEMGPLFLLCCLIMLPKVDYVLITSLFVCLKERLASGILENMVMVCNGTVWRRTVPVFIQESEGRNVYVTNPCK